MANGPPFFPAAPQSASRTGQTMLFGGSRKGSGFCRRTGRWTSMASWPMPASSSGPSTGPSSCGYRTAGPCACEPASPSPSSRPWLPSAASSVSPLLVPTLAPQRGSCQSAGVSALPVGPWSCGPRSPVPCHRPRVSGAGRFWGRTPAPAKGPAPP